MNSHSLKEFFYKLYRNNLFLRAQSFNLVLLPRDRRSLLFKKLSLFSSEFISELIRFIGIYIKDFLSLKMGVANAGALNTSGFSYSVQGQGRYG
jgi:hypothetical protein